MTQRQEPGVGGFLAELERRLDALGPQGVRRAVLAQAATLRPSQRPAFLALFDPAAASAVGEVLLGDVERFLGGLDALAASHRGRRWRDWDDDPDPYRDEELEDLLTAAGERFLAGGFEVATAAIERLLCAMVDSIDNDDAPQLGAETALVREARDRLLWCIAAADGRPNDRAERMVEVLERFALLAPAPDLVDLITAHPTALPPQGDVLQAMADRLGDLMAATPSWQLGRQVALWCQLHEHLDGLASVVALAAQPWPWRLEIYRWVVDRYAAGGQVDVAAGLADDALAALSDSWQLADLADTAARLRRQLGDPSRARAASWRAWTAHPTITRLERLLDDGEAAGDLDATIDRLPKTAPSDPTLAAAVAVLAGDVDAAVAPTRFSAIDHEHAATRLAVAVCCRLAARPAAPTVERVLNTAVDAAARRDVRVELSRRTPGTQAATPLIDRLRTSLDRLPVDPTQAHVAERLLDGFAAEVLGRKDRASYATVAALVVAVADTHARIGSRHRDLIAAYDERYRRFTTFRRELRDAAATSVGHAV